ncbi:MAG: M2 family metallopeptidase [Chloroflexi bacterium]|nr:M2 family metallopeptidase [Chloroflexota bacterium]
MSPQAEQFIEEVTAAWRRLEAGRNQAEWEVATTGAPEATERLAQAEVALKRYFANPERFATAKALVESGSPDPVIARQLKLIYLEGIKSQGDDASVRRLAELEAKLNDAFSNFRAEYKGRKVSDNEIDDVLANSKSPDDAREAWEASKRIGPLAAGTIREAARLRNQMAQALGYRDHFVKALAVEEIEETELLALFDRLDKATATPFAAVKAEIDSRRAGWFGLAVSELQPWHFGDRFFQAAPKLGDVDMDEFFADKDVVELALHTYDSLNMNTREILARSDLYAREGKNQHAFCIDMNRDGDVRTLNNLQPNRRWADPLLHERGHAVYNATLDFAQPWILRKYPHLLSTEAIALMMGDLTYDQKWLTGALGLPSETAAQLSTQFRAQERFAKLIFTRWVLVMTNFERALYANPDDDLETIWWNLVEKYQLLRRPAGRATPDWATKIHIATAPVYYHNYELGYLTSAQLLKILDREAGGLAGRPEAGQWLIEKWFRPGAKEDWAGHIRAATGEPLNPDYFVQALL